MLRSTANSVTCDTTGKALEYRYLVIGKAKKVCEKGFETKLDKFCKVLRIMQVTTQYYSYTDPKYYLDEKKHTPNRHV